MASWASVVDRSFDDGARVAVVVQYALAKVNVCAFPLIFVVRVHPPPASVMSQYAVNGVPLGEIVYVPLGAVGFAT